MKGVKRFGLRAVNWSARCTNSVIPRQSSLPGNFEFTRIRK